MNTKMSIEMNAGIVVLLYEGKRIEGIKERKEVKK